MNDALHAVFVDRFQQMLQTGNVAPVKGNAVAVGLQVGAGRRQVKADRFLAELHQLADDAVADKPGAAGNHHGHIAETSGAAIGLDRTEPGWPVLVGP